MSANTPEGRAQERTQALDAIQAALIMHAGWWPEPARKLAEVIVKALPPSCDFDCDNCRE